MKKKYNLVLILMLVTMFSICNIYNVYGALYKSRGDVIPVATIEYDEKDNIAVFPESYKGSLKALKEKHPNWTFMAVYTNLDWKDSVRHECYEVNEEISLVHMSEAACWKKDGANYFKDGTWVVASKKAVAYAMDPRNYLSEASIFQFESLSCIEGVHKLEAVEKILESTELKTKYTEDESGNKVIDYPTYNNVNNVTVKMEKTYAQVIYEAGLESGVSPIHIAARIIQETGGKLSMGSISGTNPGFEGYYNFFNIGAVPGSDNNSAVTNGLKTAKNNGWDSPEKAIKAGALTLYNSYIKYGQDTVYFQKFDVSNSKGNASMLYAFQYMTNIMAPNSESSITYSAYSKLGILDSAFVFYIPVYENMTIDKNPSPESEEVIDENNIEKNTYNEKEEVKVINVNSISVTKSNYSIKVGESINIDVKVLPDNATNTKYVSSIVKGDSSQVDIYENEVNIYGDSNVIKLEGNKVTALKTGEALVLFKTVDGEYTTSVKVTVTEKSKFEVDKEKLTINENGVITNLGIGSKVKDVLSAMNCSDNVKIECRDISGNILNDESLVGTGMSISLLEADLAVLAKYDVVIKGDVNGDAKITASDYVIIKNFIMGTSNLEKVQTDGADVNKDGKITASDYVLIKNHIMGTAPLY